MNAPDTKTKRLLSCTVRPFNSADLHAVLRIADEGWDWPRIKKTLGRVGSSMLVAVHRRWVVGFVVVQETPGRLEVLHLAVAPNVRRQGVGSFLLAAVCGDGARSGKPVAAAVREHDDAMIGLLHGAGFAGELRRGFWRDGEDGIRFTLRFGELVPLSPARRS